MWAERVAELLLIGVGGLVVWRSAYRAKPAPRDVAMFEQRYKARGLRVVAIRRVGTEWNRSASRHPIRKYEIDLETPGGAVETRLRGVSRGDLLNDRVWRYSLDGGREPLL